jgi:organic hydroperoxide reductase OsmC/OhrA
VHKFPVRLTWTGTTSTRDYDRDATALAEGKPDLPVSTAVGFGGSPTRWNPEELFGAALSNCHLQTFLSLAAKVGVDVLSYDDHVEIELVTEDKITRVARVALRPTITISAGSDPEKAAKFFDKAHKYCFIANSTTAEVVMEPTIVRA